MENSIFKYLKYYFYAYIILIFQISIVNNGLVFGFYPNLMLIYVAYCAQKFNKTIGYSIALVSGFLYDITLSSNFGIRALIFFVVAIVIRELSEFIFEESYRTSIIYTLTSIVVYSFLLYTINYFLAYKVRLVEIFDNIFSVETILSIVLFYIMQKFLFGRESKKFDFKFKIFKKEKLIEKLTKRIK